MLTVYADDLAVADAAAALIAVLGSAHAALRAHKRSLPAGDSTCFSSCGNERQEEGGRFGGKAEGTPTHLGFADTCG